MQTPCALPSVKDLDIPRETSGDGWGHRCSRRDAERCEQEYHSCIAQLLECVISSRRFDDVEAQIAKHCVICVRDNLPGSRDQPPPLRSNEEHHHVG
jgi:hypothetical protein